MYRNCSIVLVVAVLLVAVSCQNIDSDKLFSKMPSSHTNIKFKNLVVETDEFNILTYGNIYNGGGVAVGDINNDGLQDLYFTGSMVGSRLYLNKGDFKFEEIAKKAGVFAEGLWNTGTSMVDVNGDGLVDIYICRSAAKESEKRRNLLYINNGDLTFTEKAKDYGLDDPGYSTEANFFDYDRDGDLDVFIINHSVQPYSSFRSTSQTLRSKILPDYADRLYRNDNGKFTDVSRQAGIISSVLGFGLSVSISDINNDDWPDIYVSNDFHEHDFLYLNNADGTFTESLKDYLGHTSHFSMGSDIADINNDGKPDIITLDMLPEGNYRQKMVLGPDNYDKYEFLVRSDFHHQYMRNMLHLNNGNSFSEIGQFSGVHATDWSWAPLFIDLDNNGYKDLFVTNGVKRDYTNMDFMNFAVQKRLEEMDSGVETAIKDLLENMPSTVEENYTYKNKGNLTFEKVTESWGLGGESLSNGAAYADLDNDGDFDLVVNNTDQEAFIYRNNSEKHLQNNYLKIQLKGEGKNTLAIGAKAIVKTDSATVVQELYTARGFQSSVDPSLIFGLANSNTVDEVRILWPDGSVIVKKNVEANQTLVLNQADAVAQDVSPKVDGEPLLIDASTDSLLVFNHVEDKFNDFKREPLLPHMLSTQGPKLASIDVNGDGLLDIYVGGAKNQSGALFLQRPNGTFESKYESLFKKDALHEDIGALFFDANGDSQPDLYVVSGGNENDSIDGNYRDRLYMNMGNRFVKRTDLLPQNDFSGSCITSADIDSDGDQDLFIGGRLVPGKYPMAPKSQILLNDGQGKFTNGTEGVLGERADLGMVTDAIFTDFNQDGNKDLIVVGEFMPITFLSNENGKFVATNSSFDSGRSKGWWNTIVPTDIDDDGDMDYVLGNFGLNSQLKASVEQPVTLFAKDFDNNGSIDPILCCYLDGKNHPVFSKDDLTSQLNFLKDRYPNYSDYASQTVANVFAEEELKNAQKLEANTFESGILRNIGNGKFDWEPLPQKAQFSPIYSIIPADIDKDGDTDLALFGNFFDTRVKFGRYDANRGLILLNNGNGHFSATDQSFSGMNINGQVRDATIIEQNENGVKFIVAQNNGPILLFKSQKP